MTRLKNNHKWAWTDNLSLPLQKLLSLDPFHHQWQVWDTFQKGMKLAESTTKAGGDLEWQIWYNLSWEREPRWIYPTPCPVTSWKAALVGTTPLGRLIPWMAFLSLKKFLLYIKMIPLLMQLVTLVLSMWILVKMRTFILSLATLLVLE